MRRRRTRFGGWLKRRLHSRATHALLAASIAFYIRLVHASSRSEYAIHPEARPYMEGEKQAIFAVWHGCILMMAVHCRSCRPMKVLISQHRDGTMIARAIGHFGYETLRGSSSRGGARMLASALRVLKTGENIGLTPDGPRGPARQAQDGAIFLARKTGLPIVPLTFQASRARRMNSWDSFLVALPFGRLRYIAGPPIMPESADELTAALDALDLPGAGWQ